MSNAKAEAKTRVHPSKSRVRPKDTQRFVEELVGSDLHAKRVLSLANAVTGTIHGATLGVHAIGQALAQAQGLAPKHAVKQIDRLLSNGGVSCEKVFENWVPFVFGARDDVFVALDWTEFDADDHSTIALYLITSHGRATPLLWRTVRKSNMEGWRNQHEDDLLTFFAGIRPAGARRVTVLADRGFGDQKLYPFLASLGLDFIIRFRGNITVEAPNGETRSAAEWLLPSGRAVKIRDAKVTADKTAVAAVVCVQAPGMKDAWHLATSRGDLTATQTIKSYGKRFTIEETFRDCKDLRFGLGLKATHIGNPGRRDRLLLLAAIAQALLTLLGAAAEATGLDRLLKVNTAKKRTHSLFRQGCYWYGAIPNMPDKWLEPLMASFGQLVSEQPAFTHVFGIL